MNQNSLIILKIRKKERNVDCMNGTTLGRNDKGFLLKWQMFISSSSLSVGAKVTVPTCEPERGTRRRAVRGALLFLSPAPEDMCPGPAASAPTDPHQEPGRTEDKGKVGTTLLWGGRGGGKYMGCGQKIVLLTKWGFKKSWNLIIHYDIMKDHFGSNVTHTLSLWLPYELHKVLSVSIC